MLIEVIGRSFSSRFFKRLFTLIEFPLFRCGGPCRNDSDGFLRTHQMHHKQKARILRIADSRFPHFFSCCGIHQMEERVEENLTSFGERHTMFREACEVFFDPFFHLVDATAGEEVREAAIGYTENARLLFVVHLMRAEETIRIISARPATAEERKFYERE